MSKKLFNFGGKKKEYVDLDGKNSAKEETAANVSQTPPGSYTIDDAINYMGFGCFQVKATIVAGLAWVTDSVEIMLVSILAQLLCTEWVLTPVQQAAISIVMFVGQLLGSTIWGKLGDIYGRRTQLILSTANIGFYGLLTAFVPTYSWMLIIRSLVGFAVGNLSLTVAFYSEYLPMKRRGTCILSLEYFWSLGGLLVIVCSMLVSPTLGWRALVGILALPACFMTFVLVTMPESPRYNLAWGNREKSKNALQQIAKANNKKLPEGKLVDVTKQVKALQFGKYRKLFSKKYRTVTLVMIYIWFLKGFSYFGIILLTTQIFLLNDPCGVGLELTTEETGTPQCQLDCTQFTQDDYLHLIWTALAELPGTLLAMILIDLIGRKWTIVFGYCVYGTIMIFLNVCITKVVLAAMLIIARSVLVGCSQAIYAYTAELYPTNIRAIALGTCSSFGSFGSIMTPFFAQVLFKTSLSATITIYGVSALVAGIATIFLNIETSGKGLQDVEDTKEN